MLCRSQYEGSTHPETSESDPSSSPRPTLSVSALVSPDLNCFCEHLRFNSASFIRSLARCVLRQVLLCHFGSRKFSCEKHTVVWQGKAIGDFLRCTLKVWLFAHFKCEGFFFPLSSPCPSISDAGQLYRIQGKHHLLELCCT